MSRQDSRAMKAGLASWGLFVTFQVVIVSVAIAGTAYRSLQLQRLRQLPPMRNKPPTIRPLYNDPRVVTDEQLSIVLHKLRPRLRHEKVNINHVDHALRFWGVEAEFDDPECLSGQEMRELLLDHTKFVEVWGNDLPALLQVDATGVRVRTQQGLATASHYDHTLAGLAEVGTPLSFSVRTIVGTRTVREMLTHALRRFSLNQIEYEWSTLAFAMYIPANRWISSEGQEITFDRLAERITRQRLNHGVCMGNHRLHALVMLLRIDEEVTPILTDQGRQMIKQHLTKVTGLFVSSQHADGYWIRSWPTGKPPESGREGDSENTLQNRILATGHVLEWWALAPEELHPPREVVVRAGQWLARSIEELDEESIKTQYTFLSHAGRALALWRGEFPVYFLKLVKETAIDASESSASAN